MDCRGPRREAQRSMTGVGGLGTSSIANVVAGAGPCERLLRPAHAATTDARGEFELGDVPPDDVFLSAKAPHFAEARVLLALRPDHSVPDTHLVLDEGLSLSGTLVDGSNQRVANAFLMLVTDEPGRTRIQAMTWTSADGGFRMNGLQPGPCRLQLGDWISSEPVEAGGEPRTFVAGR